MIYFFPGNLISFCLGCVSGRQCTFHIVLGGAHDTPELEAESAFAPLLRNDAFEWVNLGSPGISTFQHRTQRFSCIRLAFGLDFELTQTPFPPIHLRGPRGGYSTRISSVAKSHFLVSVFQRKLHPPTTGLEEFVSGTRRSRPCAERKGRHSPVPPFVFNFSSSHITINVRDGAGGWSGVEARN